MPIKVASLPSSLEYHGEQATTRWEGHVVADSHTFRTFVGGPVSDRVNDAGGAERFEAELTALATTGMGTAFLADFLSAVPPVLDWEVGEALAETVLAMDSDREVIWPWNPVRDRRTPQASLPGADLIGFYKDSKGYALLFGEVKTSADRGSPPNVMYGRGGLTWQLESNATRLDVHHALLRWLRARCLTPELALAYRQAVARYLNSSGKDLLIIGLLLRDTEPKESDILSRCVYLAGALPPPTRVEIVAWYLPVPIAEWTAALGGTP